MSEQTPQASKEAPFKNRITSTIAAFLNEIGIPVQPAALTADTFLPGILVRNGTLLVDEAALNYPGDLLHEAGHLAVMTPEERAGVNDQLKQEGEQGPVDPRPEVHAIAWSFAAALHIGIDPALVFHEGGYHGHSHGLLTGFSVGVYPGLGGLIEAGMTLYGKEAEMQGVAPYPNMIRWLR